MLKNVDKNKSQYLHSLSQHPLIHLLPDGPLGNQAKQSLLNKVSLTQYHKNQHIFLQHDQVNYLYFLLSGVVSCHRQLPNGQECIIQLYDKPNLLNESVLWQYDIHDSQLHEQKKSLLSARYAVTQHTQSKQLQLLLNQGNLHQLTAKANQTSIVATLPVSDYFYWVEKFELGKLLTWFTSQVSRRLYQHLLSSDLLTFQSAKAKVSYYLLTHFPPNTSFVLPISQKQLANQMGLRPETLNRTLQTLQQQRLIERQGEHFSLLDITGLLALIND